LERNTCVLFVHLYMLLFILYCFRCLLIYNQSNHRRLTRQRKGDGMEREKHIKRHKELHESLDELLADFITHTGKRPSQTSIFELLQWSHKQTEEPQDNGGPDE